MFKNWTIKKRITVITINSVFILFILGVILTRRNVYDLDSSLGSAIFYSLTITLPILLIKNFNSKSVKTVSLIVMILPAIVVLFGVFLYYLETDSYSSFIDFIFYAPEDFLTFAKIMLLSSL